MSNNFNRKDFIRVSDRESKPVIEIKCERKGEKEIERKRERERGRKKRGREVGREGERARETEKEEREFISRNKMNIII